MAGAAEGVTVRAPGRVNLIGEHTDYNEGFVMPMALDLECRIRVLPRPDGLLRAVSVNLDEERWWEARSLGQANKAGDWGDYVVGVARQLPAVPAVDLWIESTVPVGSGLSSSAALEVAVAMALSEGKMGRKQMVDLCWRAETEFVGLPCGIMDQYISVFGEEGSALVLDCRMKKHQAVRLPEGIEVIAVNSMVKHALGDSAYRQRVEECRQACERLGISSLRDAAPEQVEGLEGTPGMRARHVVSENLRVIAFAAAARSGDVGKMGRLLEASHRSLQHDYEVSCEELDFLVDGAMEVPGVLGARMVGGGFGGCTVNLMRAGAAGAFEERLGAAYKQRYGITPQFYRCRPAGGASILA